MLHRACVAVAGFALMTLPENSSADPSIPQLKSRIETVGLFKNGLAVVRRTVELPESYDTFDVLDLPEPVHGTFWVESRAAYTVTVTDVEVPRSAEEKDALPSLDNSSLAGAKVTVYFKSEHLPTVQGVVAAPRDPQPSWDRSYGWARPRSEFWWAGDWSAGRNSYYVPQPQAAQLVITTDKGNVVIAPDTVAYLLVNEPATTSSETRPVLRMQRVEEPADSQDDSVSITYLTKGASWAPGYALDISDSSRMTLRQSAVIRNEIEDWTDVELLLISGFPNIEFGHVLSPLSPATDLAGFFRALGTQTGLSHSSRGDVMAQAVMTNTAMPALDVAGASIDDPRLSGMDLHYHSVGKRSLRAGESMFINTAEADASFERIVQWIVPDDRDPWGSRNYNSYVYSQREDQNRREPWDALRFENPLDRPMTTGPAMVVSNRMMRGQSMLYWSAPGEEVVLPVNKTLSVRASVSEVEEEGGREELRLYDRTFWRTRVSGTLRIINQRAEPVTIVARVEFSGDLIDAEGDPKSSLRAEGVWSVNPRRVLEWNIDMKPGETREITYSYRVLAPR